MIVKQVAEGFELPPFYGIAWVDYMRNSAVCLPVPFNVIAGFARAAWFWLRYGYRDQTNTHREAYAQGFRNAIESVRVRPD